MASLMAIPPLASFLAGLDAAAWIDIVCAVVVAVCAVHDAIRGLSATLAQIAALVLSLKAALLLYPRIAALVPATGTASVLATFAVAVGVAVAIYLALRFAIARIAHVVLIPPLDNILGFATGAAKGLLMAFVVFSVVSLVSGGSYGSTAFAKSKTGSRVMPAVERLLAPAKGRLPFSVGGR